MERIIDEEDDGIKVILIGDQGVGKTNLINTFAGLEFEEKTNSTISGSSIEKTIEIDKIVYSINLWDTAGQETYRGVTKLFFRGSNIVILVYDITNPDTFKSLGDWVKDCRELITEPFIFGVIGNKNDLFLDKKVSEEDGKTFAESINAKFKLVSAKTDTQSFDSFLTELVVDFIKIDSRKGKSAIKLNRSLDDINNNNKNSGCGGWFSNLFKKIKKKK